MTKKTTRKGERGTNNQYGQVSLKLPFRYAEGTHKISQAAIANSHYHLGALVWVYQLVFQQCLQQQAQTFLPDTYRSFTLVLGPTYQAPICQGPYIKVISPGQLPVHSKAFSCTHSSASPKHLSGHKVLWIQKGNILG